MIMIKSISLTMRREGGGEPKVVVTLDHGSGQRVREMSRGEDEDGARREGGFSIIAGSLPSGPRTAGRGTAAAAGRRLEPETGPRLQC